MIKDNRHLKNIYGLLLLLVIAYNNAPAQIKAVIPATFTTTDKNYIRVSRTDSITINFNLSTLPVHSAVDSCTLQFVCKGKVDTALTLEAHSLAAGSPMIGYKTIQKGFLNGTPVGITVEDSAQFPKPGEMYSIKLKSGKSKIGSAVLYGSKVAESLQGYAPQLIVYYSYHDPYTYLAQQNRVDFGMSNVNAQHTSQLYLRFRGTEPIGYKQQDAINYGTVKMNMVMYKDNLYMLSENNRKMSLYAINPITQSAILIKTNLISPAESVSAIDESGHFYYPNTEGVSVIDLENGNAEYKNVMSVGDPAVNALTIGADGSIYVPTINGIKAYTPFPQCKLTWYTPFGNKKSSVTLNIEGTIAYVVSEQKDSILAINTNNGKILASQKITLKVGGDNMPIPVVDKQGYVYITNKLGEGATQLTIFLPGLKSIVRAITGLNISMPATNATGGVYYVDNGELMCVTPSSDPVKQTSFSPSLSVRSLLTDATSNVYCLGRDNTVYFFKAGKPQQLKPFKLNGSADRAMVIGIDGSLYTATSNNVIAIKPSQFGGDYDLNSDIDQNPDDLTFRAQALKAEAKFSLKGKRILIGKTAVAFNAPVTVLNHANVIIKSGGSIFFGKGFKVEKGASLVCKTGY